MTGKPGRAPSPPGLLPALGLALLVAAAHGFLTLNSPAFAARELLDPDSYTRLLRVLELWRGAGWHEARLPWLGAPEGLVLHWTRPLDLLVIGAALPAIAAGIAPETALYWSAALACPVQHLLACLAAAWAARALWPPAWSWFAGLVLLLDPATLAYGLFGRADHHTLILLASLLGLGFALRAAAGRRSAALPAGLAFGAGIWVSPEAMLVALPALAAFGLLWVRGAEHAASAGLRIALGVALAVALALPVERPPAALLDAAQDRVSVQHLALALAVAGVFSAAGRLPARLSPAGRLTAGATLGALGAAALLLAWPDLLRASLAAAEGEHAARFVASAQEMQPLRFGSFRQAVEAAAFVGAVPAALLALWLGLRRGPREADAAWRAAALTVLLPLLACLAATVSARRFSLDLAAPVAVAAAGLIPLVVQRLARLGPLLRLPLLAGATALGLFVPLWGVGQAGSAEARRPCNDTTVARNLAAQAGPPAAERPPIVLADNMNLGPAIAHLAGLRAVTGPYHQLGPAFADAALALDQPDEALARAAIARRDVALVLVCPGAPPLNRTWSAEGLRARLLAGTPPAWLAERPLPAPIAAHGFRLYAVTP